MIKPFAFAGAMLAATPVFAQESADAGLARMGEFVAVFQALDCTLATRGKNAIPESELFAMFADAGFVGDDVPRYADALIGSGRAEVDLDTDGVTVLPPLCVVEASE